MSIVAAFTLKEGGPWIVPSISISIQEVDNMMDHSAWPFEPIKAILFYNGAIFDTVLLRLHYSPWRHINLESHYP